jgi:hypothetical protein
MVIVPVVIGVATVYINSLFEQRKTKLAEAKEEKNNLDKLESHYFKIISHSDSLLQYTNEPEINHEKCLFSVQSIQKLLSEVNIDVLPKELKKQCGYFIHTFDLRATELKKVVENNSSVSEIAKCDLQIFGSSQLFQQHYIVPLKSFLGS